MKEIPDGFKKMELCLTFSPKEIKYFEDIILYFLVRDYYILYSVKDKFGKGEWFEISFYCRPKDESSITYRLGCYAQAVFGFYSPRSFHNPIHEVPKGFPDCIKIELPDEK